MSKIPTPFSASLQNKSKSVKRLNAGMASPKKVRPSGAENRKPTARSVASGGRLRRSISMNNIAQTSRATIGTGRPIASGSTLNLRNRHSTVTKTMLSGANKPSTSGVFKAPAPVSAKRKVSVSSEVKAAPAGKAKRPAWDLKGRLEDMEGKMKNNETVMSDYRSRVEILETEKKNAVKSIETFKFSSEHNQEQIINLQTELSSIKSEKTQLDIRIRDAEMENASYKRQIESLEAELKSSVQEKIAVKSSLDQILNLKVGLEAEMSSTKLLLESKSKEVEHFKIVTQEQKEIIESLNKEIMAGEIERRRQHNIIQELKGNIRVFCRIRPLIGKEIEENQGDEILHINFVDDKSLELIKNANLDSSTQSNLGTDRSNAYQFSFDRIFSPSKGQLHVFEELSQLVQSALDGYNVCVFAYGQTGSGKTYTMEGVYDDEENEGMIPKTVRLIFDAIKDLENKGWKYSLDASYLEIYNENIRDLLVNPTEAKNTVYDIKFCDSKKNDIYVTNLKVVPVESASHAHDLLRLANRHRTIAATNANERSSRSHSVFQLKLQGRNEETQTSCQGTLNLVDLAGSERLKVSKSEGTRLLETQAINTSLSNLTNVIMALGQKQSHIPYRNSKLTYLLQNSLGGNSKTLMFINVSPTRASFNETLNSLRFATKVNECHIGTARQVKK